MIITSEQVGRGHPDKVADQVSDLFVTEILKVDNMSRIAIETAIKGFSDLTGKVMVFGELKTTMKNVKEVMIPKIKKLLVSIDKEYGKFDIDWQIGEQSPEINAKVDKEETKAGDQGLMFGYATDETKTRLPIPYVLATEIIRAYENKYGSNDGDYRYDSKSQVSYDYVNKKLININLSIQHSSKKDLQTLRSEMDYLIRETVRNFEDTNEFSIFTKDTEIIINNAGSFVLGGAMADAGLTGRKIIADTYGGLGRHGGGAFSGKDYTKVDRSAAYYGRYVAKKIVDSGLAKIVEIQVSYIIGEAEPVSIFAETFETGDKTEVEKYIRDNFDFRLRNIIEELDLKNIDYTKTSTLGHFGKIDLKWG